MRDAKKVSASEWRWLALAFATTVPLVLACMTDRHLAMDGANVFIRVLESRWYFIPEWTRLFSLGLMETPLVAAARAGVTDLGCLKAWYAFGMLLPQWLGLAIVWRVLPTGRKHFLALPIWSLLVVQFPMDGGLMFGGHVLAPLVWPALFLLTRRDAWDRFERRLVFGLLAALAFCYEAYLPIGLVLAACASRRAVDVPDDRERELARAAVLAALIGVGVAAVGILVPRDEGNRAGFIGSIAEPWRWPLAWVGLIGCGGFLLAWSRGASGVLRLLAWVGVAAAVLWHLLWTSPWPGPAYAARTLFLTVLPVLVVAGVLLLARGSVRPVNLFAACLGLALAFSVALLLRVNAWLGYRREVEQALARSAGLVAVERFPAVDGHPLRDAWNLPELCVLWGDQPIHAILLNPARTSWEPFDPRRERPLKNLLHYDSRLDVLPHAP